MRVLETPPRYPPFTGGVENVVQTIARHLRARGDDVLIVCADDPRGASSVGDGVPVRRLPWRFKVANTNITIGLVRALVNERWDVVETHLPTPWSADIPVLVAKLLGRGSILFFHNAIVGEGAAAWIAKLYNGTILRLTLRLVDRVTVISEPWRDYLLKIDPSAGSKLVVIPNGVDLDRFRVGPRGDGRQILFVGILDRFHRYKGLDVLLDAVVGIRRGFELTVVGDGELRPEYEANAQRLGIGAHVHFTGRIDDAALERIYGESDIYVLPSDVSDQEGGFTLTALEAMATGLPAIVAEGAGQLAVEVERDGAGVRVPAGDSVRLREAIERLLRDPDERARMGKAARSLVEREHSWADLIDRRRAIYDEVASAVPKRRRHGA